MTQGDDMTEDDLKSIEHRVLLALLRESAGGAFIQEVRFSITDLRSLIAEVRRLRASSDAWCDAEAKL